MESAKKRKRDSSHSPSPSKRPKLTKAKPRINKLTPAKPWPSVPTSVNATGPKSSHREGKNFICITRKTKLGAYLRRCKDVVIKNGYKTLHLSAMGAAIPLLLQLSCTLPTILPYSRDEIRTDVTSGTVEVQDELLPDDDDEDISYQTRSKSSLRIVIQIGDGKQNAAQSALGRSNRNDSRSSAGAKAKGKQKGTPSNVTVYQEPEQEMMDML